MQYLILIALFLIHPLGTQASETEGTIDASNKYARVCHDETCTSYGTINFKPTINANTLGALPIEITDSGITGHAWGDEVGWILLNPTGAGVSIDPNTGSLSGYAYAHTGGWLNFNPSSVSGGTEVGVSITEDGEFYGWAWLSGAYGGWVKFDCAEVETCVTTDWRPLFARMENETGTDTSIGNTTGSRRMATSTLGSTTPEVPITVEERPPLVYPPVGAPINPEPIDGTSTSPLQDSVYSMPGTIEGVKKDERGLGVQNMATTQYRRLYLNQYPIFGEPTEVPPDCAFCIVIKGVQSDTGLLKLNIIPETLEVRIPLSKFLNDTRAGSEVFDIDAFTALTLTLVMGLGLIFVLYYGTFLLKLVYRTI